VSIPSAEQQGQGTATHDTAPVTGTVAPATAAQASPAHAPAQPSPAQAPAATQSAAAQAAAAIDVSDVTTASAPITNTLTPAELGDGGIASIYPPLDYPPLFPPIVSPLHGIVKADASLSALPTVASSVAPAVNASA
jgi:hypothetical protein